MVSDDIHALAAEVIAAASRAGLTAATAESCTGGLVAGALTGVPGSSAVFDRAFITYSNIAKTQMLGVDASLFEQHGAVSEAVARAMAAGARERSDADLAVSVTGIAGPGGGSDDKPVGLVHFACAGPKGLIHQYRLFGDIGREAVRLGSVKTALDLLLRAV